MTLPFTIEPDLADTIREHSTRLQRQGIQSQTRQVFLSPKREGKAMKLSMRIILVAALSLGFVMTEPMLTEATVHAGKKEKKAKKTEKRVEKRKKAAKKAVRRTTKLLQRARKVFDKTKQNKEALYRGAVNQRAARSAYWAGRYNQATHLTLVARRKARKVIQANKGELNGDESSDSTEETGAAEEAGSAEYLLAVEKEKVPQDTLIEMVLKAVIN